MAKIFYSLAGEGRGHATRVRAMVAELQHSHSITIFAPAAAHDLLKDSFAESPVSVRRIRGLMFHYSHHRLNYIKTIVRAAKYLARLPGLIKEMQKQIDQEQPDLVITDFEPALPWAAKRCGVPFISLDHQHFLVVNDLTGLPAVLRIKANLMAPIVNAYYSGQAKTIVSSFYFPPLKPKYQNAVVQIGTLLRPEILAAKPEKHGHLLVYLRRFGRENVLAALKQLSIPVKIYGLGEQPPEDNLIYCKVDETNFLHDLATCEALISNAGNQLMGEAMYLGKPVLVMPETKNFEQYINAHYLKNSGGGDWMEEHEFDINTLRSFVDNLDDYICRTDRDQLVGNKLALTTVEALLQHHATHPTVKTPSLLEESVV